MKILRILIVPLFLVGGLSCNQTEEVSERELEEQDRFTDTENDNLDREELSDKLAQPNVPISGTNLVFSVPDTVDENSVDAYVVGDVERAVLTKIGPLLYELENVPVGEQEIIITGNRLDGEELGEYNSGLRFKREFTEDEVLEEGLVELPFTGSQEGRLEMIGVSSFATVEIDLVGTKIPPITPNADGSYVIPNVPVGEHTVNIKQASNAQVYTSQAEITEGVVKVEPANTFVYSVPNQPNNLTFESYPNAIYLAWNSGGAGSENFVVLRSEAPFDFAPKAGMEYKVGDQFDNLTVVFNGMGVTYVDAGLNSNTNYYYGIYSQNSQLVYSKQSTIAAQTQNNDSSYKYYRINVKSNAVACDGTNAVSIQSIRFYINGEWLKNDYSNETRSEVNDGGVTKHLGLIGDLPAKVHANNIYNPAYYGFYAFQNNNNMWSSAADTYDDEDDFDALSEIYLQAEFVNGPVAVRGLEVIGGEPPLYPECAPDHIDVTASNDGTNWVAVVGSDLTQNTEDAGIRYYFTPKNEPLTPVDYRLLTTTKKTTHIFTSAQGTEVGYLLARSLTPEPFSPEDGTAYSEGTLGAYEIISVGTDLRIEDSNLKDDGTVYYYSLFSYDGSNNYSRPIAERAVPQSNEKYRFYRFVVDSVVYGKRCWIEELAFQINGEWPSHNFSSNNGQIGGIDVTLTPSSEKVGNEGYKVFTPGSADYWRSGQYFDKFVENSNATRDDHEYIQLEFAEPVDLTGYNMFSNDIMDDHGNDVSIQYNELIDEVHMERSLDGVTWEVIPLSPNNSLFTTQIIQEW